MASQRTSRFVSRRTFLGSLTAVVGAASAVPLLSACSTPSPAQPTAAPSSGQPAPTQAPAQAPVAGGTLSVLWIPGHKYKALETFVAEFEKDFRCKVEFEYLEPPEARQKFLATAAAGAPSDLVEEDFMTQEVAQMGYVEPLTKYVEKDGKAIGYPDDWQPSAVERQDLDGKHYGVQMFYTNLCLYYNKDMFAEAGISGPPTTWDAFLNAALKTTKRTGNNTDVWGYVEHYQQRFGWMWFYQAGAQWYDPKTNKVLTDSPAAIEALQFQSDLIHKHKVAPEPKVEAGSANPRDLFIAGKTAMMTSGPWDIKPIITANPKFKWSIAVPPKGKVQATTSYGTGLLIPAKAKNKDLAWELVKKLSSLEWDLAVTKEANMVCPRKTWAQHADVQGNELIKPFAEAAAYAADYNAGIRLTGKGDLYTTLWQETFDNILFGKMSAADALAQYTKQANETLSKA
ncbi:MAG: extracellular solute-binding protein [Actinobacteria bacterium]|nr:extracellular solute-binding protein [Actinomycetota bacterium]MDA8218121.1 extracellular solute-binding protein [Dehalococcoidales bacterium]